MSCDSPQIYTAFILLKTADTPTNATMMKPEEIRITVIVDNTPLSDFSSEHGFSLWIEAGGSTLLFDTGRSTAFSANLHKLEIELSRADMLVLSHGHYDHTGGVAQVLREVPAMKVCMHPGALTQRWSIREGWQNRPTCPMREKRPSGSQPITNSQCNRADGNSSRYSCHWPCAESKRI